MTKHEALTYLNMTSKPLSKKDLCEHFSIAKSTGSEAINRWCSQELVRPARKIRKEVYYVLTEKGKERLEYFDENGCRNEGCGCYDK